MNFRFFSLLFLLSLELKPLSFHLNNSIATALSFTIDTHSFSLYLIFYFNSFYLKKKKKILARCVFFLCILFYLIFFGSTVDHTNGKHDRFNRLSPTDCLKSSLDFLLECDPLVLNGAHTYNVVHTTQCSYSGFFIHGMKNIVDNIYFYKTCTFTMDSDE